MGFFLSPIKFVFVYGLALIAAVTIIWYGIIDLKSKEPIIETVTVVETVTEYVPVNSERESTFPCERIAGCEVFPNATTDKEYCPTCVMK